jgi:hypothetical protein
MRFEKVLSEAPSIAPEKLARLCVNYRHYPDKRVFQTLADKLGVHPAVFDRFHVGYDGRAFSFIMLGADGEIVGIRLRTLDGRKYAVKGGRNGLFVPTQHMNPLYPLIVTEGESDCMAAFQMGFQVVGIPGIGQCQKLLADWMDGQGFREAVLFADNDPAGLAGANALADYLVERKINVRIICPPRQYKDFREWFNDRVKRIEVLERIEKAPYHIGARLSGKKWKSTLTVIGGKCE